MTTPELQAAYLELVTKTVDEADSTAAKTELSLAKLHAREDMEYALSELKTHVYAVASVAPNQRWREQKKLGRAVERYIRLRGIALAAGAI